MTQTARGNCGPDTLSLDMNDQMCGDFVHMHTHARTHCAVVRQHFTLIGWCACGGVFHILKGDLAIGMHSHTCVDPLAYSTMPVTAQPGDFIPTESRKNVCCCSWIYCCRSFPIKEDLPPTHEDDVSKVVPRHVEAVQSAFPAILSDDQEEDCDDGDSDMTDDTEISDFIRGYPSSYKEEKQ
ncbi:hypothetical protein TSMEX_001360 [Taenia solium]|eukprot:TsM_001215700 transcript=TsM_001215700 gene=TsM_001215700